MSRHPFIFTLILLLVLSGCTAPLRAAPQDTAAQSGSHVSLSQSSEAKAMYHFAEADLKANAGDFEGAAAALLRALEFDTRSAFLRFSLARVYLQLDEEEKAVRAAEDALIQDPSLWEVHLLLGNYYFEHGGNEKAAAHYRRLVELTPEKESAYLHLGISLARAGEIDQAVDVIKRALQQNPESLVAELTLARLYREIDLTVLAEESYRRILSHRPEFEPAYIELAEMHLSKGKEEKALEVYRQALEENPENTLIRHQMARVLIGQNRFGEALGELQAILDRDPRDLDAWRKIGLIRMEQEDWTAAVEVFSELLENHPEYPEQSTIRFYLGTALERREDWREALEVFREIPPESELYGDTLSHLGFLLYRLDRTDEAISLLEQRLGEAVGRPELYIYLSSLHQAKEEFEAALTVLNKGSAVYPDDAELAYQKGVVLERMGRSSQASAAMRQVLRLEPDHAEALNFLAYSFAESGENLEEALVLALRALELQNQGHILDTLGWVYFKLGRLDDARHALEGAVEMLPSDPLVLEHLGDVLNALQLYRQARSVYEQALEIAPQSETVRDKVKNLPGGG